MMNSEEAIIEIDGERYIVEGFHITEIKHLYIRLKSIDGSKWMNYHIQKNFDPKRNKIIDLIK